MRQKILKNQYDLKQLSAKGILDKCKTWALEETGMTTIHHLYAEGQSS